MFALRRREFVTLLGGAAVAWPFAARAQQVGKVFRIGCLGPSLSNPQPSDLYHAFLAQMRELGFSEGQNLIAEYRALEDPRGPFVVAADLLRAQPDLIVALGPEVTLQAVVAASGFVPVVFVAVNFDPLARGYVASLARPGGNVTGVVFQQLELAQKQVELLTQAFPERTRMAVFFDAQSADQFGAAERTAKSLNLHIQPLKLENPPYNFDAAFRHALAAAAQMVLVLSSPFFIPHRARIGELAIDQRVPTMFINKDYVRVGGLMSYGADYTQMWRRCADYAAKILKGAKPADLPIEQASKFEIAVNLKTAKAIGIELPTSILLRADEVIE
jgi:putative tryptophan/tyrosine transport system substrate-binding protein